MKVSALGLDINARNLLFLLFIFPFFVPNIVGIMPVFKVLYLAFTLWKLISMVIGCFYILYILFCKKKLPGVLAVLLAVFQLVMLISTVYNRGDVITAVEIAAQTCILCFCVEFAYRFGIGSRATAVLYKLFYGYLIVDFLCMLFVPHITERYAGIYGNKNNHIFWILPFVILLIMHKRGEKSFWPHFLLAVITTVLTRSATSIAAVALVMVVLTMACKLKIRNWLNMKLGLVIVAVVNLALITFQVQPILDVVIALLNKTATYGRQSIWITAWTYIVQSPILGLGYEYGDVLAEKIRYTHMHNKLLDVLYTGGVIGLVVFGLFFFILARELARKRHLLVAKLLFGALLGCFVVFLFEGKRYDYAFWMCSILIYNDIRTYDGIEEND